MWHRCSEVRTDLPAFGVASVSLNLTLADLQSGAACARLVALLQPGQVRLPAATLRPWTSSLGQKAACALGTLLARPPTKTHRSFQWWLSVYTRPSSLCVCWMSQRFSRCLLSTYFCRGTVQTRRLTAVVVSWGTPEALFGPGSQSWFRCHSSEIKTWHATQTPQNHRGGRGCGGGVHGGLGSCLQKRMGVW